MWTHHSERKLVERLREIEGHKAMVSHVELADDGLLLVSASNDRTVRNLMVGLILESRHW